MVGGVVVAGEHGVREPVIAHELPDVFLRVHLAALAGRAMAGIFGETASRADLCHPAWSSSGAVWLPGATWVDSSASKIFIVTISH